MREATMTNRKLENLAAAAGDLVVRVHGEPSVEITRLAYDSRSASPGTLFFCVPGTTTDGHLYAAAAVDAGASALVVERPLQTGVPEIEVTESRRAMARMAAAFYGYPAEDLILLGVTGTNGKTTTVFLLESVLRAAGKAPGLIGTIETRVGGVPRPGVRTTPESLDLHALFAEMRAAGAGSVAMEVTSHALALHRVEGVRFAAAAFTNLSQDHLDFHTSMEDYFEAKRSLFAAGRVEHAAINVDDAFGRRLFEERLVPATGFGLARDADVRAEAVDLGPHGSAFTLVAPQGEARIESSLVGTFNVSNCLATAATALGAGIGLDEVASGIRALRAVPGRLEAIDGGQPFGVLVDYAHTPDSLDNVLRAARGLVRPGGRLLCTFGCGGDRDRGKRPLMGAVAARLADYVVVTSDNPRSEDPDAIISEILEGFVAQRVDGPDLVVADRAAAIAHTLKAARPGDVVLVAGKGHETGQQFADRTIPFDDRAVSRVALAELGWDR